MGLEQGDQEGRGPASAQEQDFNVVKLLERLVSGKDMLELVEGFN